MSSSPPPKTHPLKRILSKQSFRSRTWVDLARTKEDASELERSATPGSGIARTLIEVDENRQEADSGTAAVPEDSASPAADSKREEKRRMSMGGKIKWFGGADKKEKFKPAAAPTPAGSGTALTASQGSATGATEPSPEAIVKHI